MQIPRRLALSLLLFAVVGIIVYGFWPRPLPVDMAAVSRGAMRVTVDEEGRTRVIDRYVVSAPVAGYARRIDLNAGDTVEKGQVLVELEPLRSIVLDPRSRAEAEARVEAARSSLLAAQEQARAAAAEAEYAAAEYRRKVKLCEKDCIVSKEEMEKAQSLMQSSKAQKRSAEFAVEVARFELNAAKTALEHSAAKYVGEPSETVAIQAPISGRVLKVERQSEGVVNSGQPLIEIGDPRALEVVVDVLSPDAVRIGVGSSVLFERWGGEQALEGRVRVVEPAGFTKISALGIEEQRVQVVADIVSPPDQWLQLGDGYRVEARFILWQGSDVLQVPTSALFRHGEEWAVFVVEEGRAIKRHVKIGHQNGLSAEVLSGLAEGDLVITHPDDAVEQDSRVRRR